MNVPLSAPAPSSSPPALAPAHRLSGPWRLALPVLVVCLLVHNVRVFAAIVNEMPGNDFGKAYHSTVAFLAGGEMYGPNVSTPPVGAEDSPVRLWNLNPPHFHLLMLPFALLPPWPALALWCVSNAALTFVALRRIDRELALTPGQRLAGGLGLLAFLNSAPILLAGHCSALLLLLVVGGWSAARNERWARAGLCLGVGMSIKPFLLFLAPYFLLTRRWRALAASAVGFALCFALGVAVFGWENHRDWMSKFATAGEWTWFGYNGSLYGMFSRSLTDNPLFVPLSAAPPGTVRVLWLIVAAPIGLATLAAAARVGLDRAIALLLVGAILLSPLGWSYYFCLAVAPTAAVVLSWRAGPGASPWSKRLLTGGLALMLWPLLPSGLIPFDLGQPNPAATLLIANLCSYSLLAVWIALLVDAVRARRLQASWMNPRTDFAQERTVTFPLPRLALEDQRVSVVMPVFNETDTVRLICDWLRTNLDGRLLEIIVVQSPRSGEESQAICRALADEDGRIRVYQQQNNPGVGHAFREGYARARGNVVLSMDSDNEMELAAIPRMLACLAEGNHGLVVGSRWAKGGGFVGYSRFKRWLNWGFQQLFRLLFNTRLHDLTYGFKALRAEVVHGIAWEAQLHEIGCETTLKPVYLGVRVGEVPSTWTARTQGRSTNNFWRNFRYVATALRILWRGAPLAQPERPIPATPLA